MRRLLIRDGDPLIANLLICLAFFLLGLVRLQLPQVLYFDEEWYLPAAAKMLKSMEVINREHPMLGKELIAAFYWLFGGSWISARIGSLVFGTIGLFGFQRAHFTLTQSPASTMVFGTLVLGNCLYLATSRIALLDPYMLGFAGVGLAFFAKGMRFEHGRRLNFALAGLAMGMAMACKWTVAPLCLFMAVATVVRFHSDMRELAIVATTAAVPAAVVYAVTFIPLLFASPHPMSITDFLPLQRAMAFHLSMYIGEHPYQSYWWQWPIGTGQMWLFNGEKLGIDRVIILAQNPVAVLISLPAVLFGLFALIVRRNLAMGIPALAYLLTVGFWALGQKPNLYLYHYNLPAIFALSAAAQIGASLSGKWLRTGAIAIYAAYFAAFAFFYPVVTGARIDRSTDVSVQIRGWTRNPEDEKLRRPVGSAYELGAWAMRCLNEPTRAECAEWRRNSVEPQ